MRIGLAAVAAVAVVGVAGCTSDQPTYGAASAGPTLSAEPTTPDAVPSAAPSVTESSTRERVRPCVFSTGEIAKVLGLPVRPAVRTVRGPSVVCTWRSTVEPVVPAWRGTDPVTHWDDGIVTITRTDSAHYDALVSEVVSLAHRQKATGRHPLPGVGGDAFAIGASVSGVPIWHAVALAHGQAVAIEVSGADSHASQATVSDFLLTVADEG
jgi:hypothetical protein